MTSQNPETVTGGRTPGGGWALTDAEAAEVASASFTAPDAREYGHPLPGDWIWLGRAGLSNRLEFFQSEDDATTWLGLSPGTRRVWKCQLAFTHEYELEPPVRPKLVMKDG